MLVNGVLERCTNLNRLLQVHKLPNKIGTRVSFLVLAGAIEFMADVTELYALRLLVHESSLKFSTE